MLPRQIRIAGLNWQEKGFPAGFLAALVVGRMAGQVVMVALVIGWVAVALVAPVAGQAGLVTLVGEPGIGKTRTAQELTTYAGLRSA